MERFGSCAAQTSVSKHEQGFTSVMMFQNNPLLYFATWKLGLQPALTQTSDAEIACLRHHAAGRRRLVEIGVWHGVNTRNFRQVMAQDGILYAIDPFPLGRFGKSWHRPIAYGEVGRHRNGSVHFLECFSKQAIEKFRSIESERIDFLFIDGDHSYEGVQTDWNLWTPLIGVGGIVALHDSRAYPGRDIHELGPARFTRDVVLRSADFELVQEVDSLTVVRRK